MVIKGEMQNGSRFKNNESREAINAKALDVFSKVNESSIVKNKKKRKIKISLRIESDQYEELKKKFMLNNLDVGAGLRFALSFFCNNFKQ